ncbi:MAG: NAD-dependent epimerase/dehydratase family protein [Methanoregulaceae archaeon]|nr:NAD-dependent epimerase/dehydratase family protein [Methanoregulaceae archaeon]
MRILVTGSTGFIGAALCRALVEQGHDVRAFHRSSSNLRLLDGLPVEHSIGDLTQPETIEAALQDIEVVFHAAAWMGSNEPGKLYAVTVEGTRTVAQAALKAGVERLVHTSSVAALGAPSPNQPELLNECHTWNLRPEDWSYGYAKYLAELEIQKAVAKGLDAVIVNPTVVFGKGDIYRKSSSTVRQVAARKIGVVVEGGLNAVHLSDVVEGHLSALARGIAGERYILGGENLTILSFIQLIARVTSVPAPSVTLPGGLVRTFRRPVMLLEHFLDLPVSADLLIMAGRYFYYDIRKAQDELLMPAPRPVEQAVADAFAWFQAG